MGEGCCCCCESEMKGKKKPVKTVSKAKKAKKR